MCLSTVNDLSERNECSMVKSAFDSVGEEFPCQEFSIPQITCPCRATVARKVICASRKLYAMDTHSQPGHNAAQRIEEKRPIQFC